MAISKKRMHQLKSTMKRRELRPASTYQPPAKLEITRGERNRITRDNPGMLLTIESLIVETWEEFGELNDDEVQQVLVAVLRKQDISGNAGAQALGQALLSLAARWNDGEGVDQDFHLAVAAILSSVKTRSDASGTRNYLNYAADFVAQAKAKSRTRF